MTRRSCVELRSEVIPLLPDSPGGRDLRARLDASSGTRQRDSAEWELMTFDWLLARTRWAQPGPGHGTGRENPDFLVETHAGDRLFVECLLVQPDKKVQGERVRIMQLKSALDSLDLEDCILALTVHAVGPRTMPWARLLAEVRSAASEATAARSRGFERQAHFRRDGWDVDVTAMCLGEGLGGVKSWTPDVTRIIADEQTLRTRIEKKRDKYRELGLPLVVAIALESGFSDDNVVRSALFGPEVLRVPLDGSPASLVSIPSGFWFREARIDPRGVPAVIISHDFSSGNCHRESLSQWVCPSSSQPFPGTGITLRARGDSWVSARTVVANPGSLWENS